LLIAVSGPVGVGKSLVTDILRSLGAAVVSADEINAELLTNAEYIKNSPRSFRRR